MYGYADTLRQGLADLRALEADRAAVEIRIDRPDGDTVTDQSTGEVTRSTAIVWTGLGRIARAEQPMVDPRPYAAGHYETINSETVRVPVDCPAQVGDILTIVSDPDAALNTGRVFNIANIKRVSQSLATRLTCTEIQQG